MYVILRDLVSVCGVGLISCADTKYLRISQSPFTLLGKFSLECEPKYIIIKYIIIIIIMIQLKKQRSSFRYRIVCLFVYF